MDLDGADVSLFEEPSGYFQPPPTETSVFHYDCDDNAANRSQTIDVKLVPKHSLWAHRMWNAGIVISRRLADGTFPCADLTVLELGAGGALPSLVAERCGARRVVITDYPEDVLLNNIRDNVAKNVPAARQSDIVVLPHLWGDDTSTLIAAGSDSGAPPSAAHTTSSPTESDDANSRKFDIVLLCDLIFNHSQHTQLLKTVAACLRPTGAAPPAAAPRPGDEKQADPSAQHPPYPRAVVAFTHHKPHLAHKDNAFFEMAQQAPFHFAVRHLWDEKMLPMFEKDLGSADVRATIHVYEMTLPLQNEHEGDE